MTTARLKRADFLNVALLVLLASLAIAGMAQAYFYYRDTLRDAQQQNLTTMAQSASATLSDFFELRFRELDLQFGEASMERALGACDGDHLAAVETLLETFDRSAGGTGTLAFVPVSSILSAPYSGLTLGQNGMLDEAGSWPLFIEAVSARDEACLGYWYREGGDDPQPDDGYVMTLWRVVRSGEVVLGYVIESISLDEVYAQTLASVQVGEMGYCTVKDPQTTIVMHRVRNQIGSVTNVDRLEGHPEGDWNDLSQTQYSGEPGCQIVTSYWWDHPEAGLAQKFIGYAPAYIDGQFFVVNVVMSYDELMEPLQTMWILCIVLGALVLVAVAVGGWRFAKTVQRARDLSRELEIQKELVAQTQLVKLQERQIQHIDRLQTAGIVTSSVAHEMKNHMTPLMIYGQMLQVPDLPESERIEAAEEVEKLSQRCSEMLEQMLSYVRKRPDSQRADQSVFDATAAVLDSVTMVRPMCPRNIVFLPQVDERPCMLEGDSGAIGQIILNLVTNALYAMRQSGGTLTLSWGPDDGQRGIWALEISDTGCGMDEEVRKKLFSTFFTTKGDEGTGLGMSVVQSLVHGMHGSVEVWSLPGEGSRFTIRFSQVNNQK